MSLFPASEHTSRLIPGILFPIPLTIHTCLTMVGLGVAGSWALSKWMKDKRHRRKPSRASVAVAVSNLEVELREKETELERLRRSLKAREEEALRRDDELKAVKAELDRRKASLSSTESQAQILQLENASLLTRIQSLSHENQQFRAENEELTSRLGHTTQLLETRTAELSGAQRFLTKSDSFSGADVMKMVEALNGEILQTAAFMAESFVFDSKRRSASTPTPGSVAGIQPPAARHVNSEDHKEAWGGATDILGHRMVQLLRSAEHHDDPMLVQIAFQAAMSAYAHWVITSWYFEDPEDEHLLNEIYARVRESEEQAISGRWRALTRTHLQRMFASEPDLCIYMITAFVHILITAGIASPASTLHERINTEFKDRITLILRAAMRLNKVVGEAITSCDLEAFYVAPEVTFNSQTMGDAYAADGKSMALDDERVLCTTDLGLVRAERKPGKDAEWMESVLLKPKVVLLSGVQDMIQMPTEDDES